MKNNLRTLKGCQRFTATLTLQAFQEFRVANMFLCPVPKSLVVTFSPGVHLAIFGQSDRKLTSTSNFDDIQVLELLNQLRRLAAVAAASAQFPVVAVSPRPHLT